MKSVEWIWQQALQYRSEEEINSLLPSVASPKELLSITDDRYLSIICRRVFRAGLKHSLVDSKWPAFERAFWHFDPEKLCLLSDEQLERFMDNAELIRHFGKIKSIRANALMVAEVSRDHGSFGQFIADWPVADIIGLWAYLKKHGRQLGGHSGPAILRMVGKDTFRLTDDVVTALVAQDIVSKTPTSKSDLAKVQAAFNQWHEQSGRPMAAISLLLALGMGPR